MKKTDILFIGAIAIGIVLICINFFFIGRIKNINSRTGNMSGGLVFVRNSDLERFDSVKSENNTVLEYNTTSVAEPIAAAVSTSGTAAKIAEAVWHSVKGYDYYNYNIVSVTLVEDSYWIVEARVPYSRRCLILEINKKDGQIMRMFDEKTGI